MNYEITGRIIVLNETQSFPSGFQKREFVLEETEGKYPQQIKFEAMKDGCAKLDAFAVGDTLTVGFNVRGNEYNGKYYVSLQAWKISGEPTGIRSPEYGKRETSQNGAAPPPTDHVGNDDGDEIPF